MMTRFAIACALAFPLAACGTTITGTAEQMCDSIKPIRPSRKDVLTQGTKEQIVGTNAAIETWCGPGQGAPSQKVAANG